MAFSIPKFSAQVRRIYVLLIAVSTITFAYSQNTVGLLMEQGSFEGYVLFAPLNSKQTYLIDKCGRQLHQWESAYYPCRSVYLLPNGHLLRAAIDEKRSFSSGAGIIQMFDWNNTLVWEYLLSNEKEIQHHDIYPMKNGNVLTLVWEKISREEAIANGRNPELLGEELWVEKIVELKPSGKNDAEIVWVWRIWDHLVQDFDETKSNYGTVSRSPQLFNLNYNASKDPDWLHFNSICYNVQLDQILISNRNFNEIFIIDHSTTTQQAAHNRQGIRKHGGDLLFRWGNPAAYNMGNKRDQKLYYQHSASWIEYDPQNVGKIIVFNNGLGRREPDSVYSSVEIIAPRFNIAGNYLLEPGKPYGPEAPYWTYTTPEKINFYSFNVSSAQRLPNQSTLICSGEKGYFFEIDKRKNIVWNYVNPVSLMGILKQGDMPINNQVYRCSLYPLNFSAFSGKSLVPGKQLESGQNLCACELKSDKNGRKRAKLSILVE